MELESELERMKVSETEKTINSNFSPTYSSGATPKLPESEDPNILISRLLQEMQALRQENRKLSSDVESERKERAELEAAKNSLTAEIEELTKTLFEEANGMVAVEAQARWSLEQTQKRLEADLAKTREALELEAEQTRLLREIVEEEKGKNAKAEKDPVLWDVDVFAARLNDSYYEDFFQEKSFDSRNRSNFGHWEALSQKTAESLAFRAFSSFMDECFRIGVGLNRQNRDRESHQQQQISDETLNALLGHAFMRECLYADIEPCLAFSPKSKSMIKKLIPAVFKNLCIIEPIPSNVNGSSANPPASPESIRASPLSIRSFISIAPARSKTSSPVKTNTSSAISIPALNFNMPLDSNYPQFGSSPASITSIESCPVSPTTSSSTSGKCTLCESSASISHRFRISGSPWNLICKHCRDRLVSVAHFFTILRHLLHGLHSHRPKLDVYFDFLQAKRYMFYTRSGVEATFYALCDFEAFSKKISDHSNN